MRTKIILTLTVIISLLFLTNWLTGRYLASRVDLQLRQIAETEDGIHYEYSSIKVNPALRSLAIRNLVFTNDETVFEARHIRGSVTLADIRRIIRNRSDNPLSDVRSFRLNIDRLKVGSSSKVRTLNLIYSGRMDELALLVQDRRQPQLNHRFTLTMQEVTDPGVMHELVSGIPAFQNYRYPEHFDLVRLQLQYLGGPQVVQLNNLLLQSSDLKLAAQGMFRYGEGEWPATPGEMELSYELNAATHDMARLPLRDNLGGFSMDSLSVRSKVHLEDTGKSSLRHPLTWPGENSVYLDNIHWYPPERLTEQYSMLFGMIGVSHSELPVRSVQADYRISGDSLIIEDALLATKAFDAAVRARVAFPEGLTPDISEGSLTFVRTSAAFNDFVDGIEGLFQIELPRRDGRIHFQFSGDPRSPDFDLDLPF